MLDYIITSDLMIGLNTILLLLLLAVAVYIIAPLSDIFKAMLRDLFGKRPDRRKRGFKAKLQRFNYNRKDKNL